MARVTGPLCSFDVRKKIGPIVFSFWRGINYARRLVVPQNPQTTCQMVIRKVVTRGSQGWKNGVTGIKATQQAQWNSYSAGSAESGIDRFMRAFIAENYSTPCTMQTPVSYPTPA